MGLTYPGPRTPTTYTYDEERTSRPADTVVPGGSAKPSATPEMPSRHHHEVAKVSTGRVHVQWRNTQRGAPDRAMVRVKHAYQNGRKTRNTTTETSTVARATGDELQGQTQEGNTVTRGWYDQSAPPPSVRDSGRGKRARQGEPGYLAKVRVRDGRNEVSEMGCPLSDTFRTRVSFNDPSTHMPNSFEPAFL